MNRCFNSEFINYFLCSSSLSVYDNSCNLHEYCLNRDSGFFKHTKFLVDRFHWFNHKVKLVPRHNRTATLDSQVPVHKSKLSQIYSEAKLFA